MILRVARSVSPVESLDLNYVARDAATSEDWQTVASSSFSSATGTSLYYPVATGSFAPQYSPMANNGVGSTSYYTQVAGSISSKATPWLATYTPSKAQAAAQLTLNEINGASDIFMEMYKDMPSLSTSPLSSTSTAGLNTPVTDNNAVDDILRNMGLPDWVVSGDYNEFDALGFLADPNKDVGGGGGLPADAPHALEALPGPLSSPTADVAEHGPDRHDANATHVEAPTLSSVPHATFSSSRSRAHYSLGGKTVPGAPIVLAHSDAADDVEDHERAAATVKRSRKKRAQRGAAEAAQFAPAEDPCANDEALARQLAQELSLPRTTRSSGSSASSTKRKRTGAEASDALPQFTQDLVSARPVRGKAARTSKRAVVAPNPLATAVFDVDIVMSEDEQPLASTSRTPDPSRPIKPLRSRTVNRPAAVPTSNYEFDSDMGDDNVIPSSSRLRKSTDDDDDFVCPSDADDSEDEDWSLRPKGGQKRKNESKPSAERSKKRVRPTAPESDAQEEIDDVQEDPNEPEPGVKVLEKRYGIYVTSADLRQRKADVKVPDDLRCRPCNKTLADDDSYRRHMVATLKHQPAGYKYHPHMCNLCGDDSVRRDSLLRHVFHLHKGKKKATKSVARMLKEHDALWKDRAVNSRISRRVCDQE